MTDFTHFNNAGRARMVDVGEKAPTRRTAAAGARVLVNRETFALIRSGGMKKGDVLTTAQIAGIMGAKRTPEATLAVIERETRGIPEAIRAESMRITPRGCLSRSAISVPVWWRRCSSWWENQIGVRDRDGTILTP